MMNNLDAKDNEIVRLLSEDARLTYSDIGKVVGLSRTAVKTRVAALEKAGIIKGYKAIVNPFASTTMVQFVVNIETKPEHFEAAKAWFAEAEQTKTLIQTSGRCHLVAVCLAEDVTAMREYLNGIYKTLPGIVSINANAVLEVIKGGIISE